MSHTREETITRINELRTLALTAASSSSSEFQAVLEAAKSEHDTKVKAWDVENEGAVNLDAMMSSIDKAGSFCTAGKRDVKRIVQTLVSTLGHKITTTRRPVFEAPSDKAELVLIKAGKVLSKNWRHDGVQVAADTLGFVFLDGFILRATGAQGKLKCGNVTRRAEPEIIKDSVLINAFFDTVIGNFVMKGKISAKIWF